MEYEEMKYSGEAKLSRYNKSSLWFTKEIKNAPECIVELYKHAGIF